MSVSAYPEGHPESGSIDRDIEYLKAKVDAGATRAITQFFFDNDLYMRYLDRVRAKGATNIRVLAELPPCEMEFGHWLLPVPLTHRHNLEDSTALFDMTETPGAVTRIGLAHGSI